MAVEIYHFNPPLEVKGKKEIKQIAEIKLSSCRKRDAVVVHPETYHKVYENWMFPDGSVTRYNHYVITRPNGDGEYLSYTSSRKRGGSKIKKNN